MSHKNSPEPTARIVKPGCGASSRRRTASVSEELIKAASTLAEAVQPLSFGPPITHVYNPLLYAWRPHESYLRAYGQSPKRVLFLGMNPGPFGMAQTGIPFGEVQAVRGWMRIQEPVGRPLLEHSKRMVTGFDCSRSEVSGRRLWGLFAQRFGTAESFFAEHFVANYCPLLFMEASGCNRTPDKLPTRELTPLLEACNEHLRSLVRILRPEWVIGIGRFAEERARSVLGEGPQRIGTILHPSPASPSSNRDWEGTVTGQLQNLGVWP